MENNITNISGGFLGAIKELTKRESIADSSENEQLDSPDLNADQDTEEDTDSTQQDFISETLKFPNLKEVSIQDNATVAAAGNKATDSIPNEDALEASIIELQRLLKSRLPAAEPINPVESAPTLEIGSADKAPVRQLPSYQGEPGSVNQLIADHLDELDINNFDTTTLVEIIRPDIFQNFSSIAIDQICKPDIAVAGPLLEILKYTRHKPSIVRLCANLMSTAMNRETARLAHPGFIEVIRSLTSDEARIIDYLSDVRVIPVIDIKKVMLEKQSEMRLNTLVSTIGVDANCEHQDLSESYLANLERIGIVEIPRDVHLTNENIYDRILNAPPVKEKLSLLSFGGKEYRGEVTKYYAKLSIYGLQFSMSCIGAGANS